MNRGGLQKSPVQQMMSSGSCPNWWNMMNNNMRPQQTTANTVSNSFLAPNSPNLLLLPHFSPTILPPSSSLPIPSTPWIDNQDQLPESWSQLLVGGLMGEEDKLVLRDMQVKKLENNWEEELFENQAGHDNIDAKQKNLANSYNMYHEHANNNVDFHRQMMPISSPKSCVTTLTTNNNILDFSNNSHQPPDHSSECNSRVTGGAPNKKARVQPSTTQSTFKVRKEKLGDRITALHQLVSPFGKTDTASVLLEAIGYIRFLQSQIEALSLPYLGNGSGNIRQQNHQQCVQGERNSLFPEDPGQLSNDNCLKRKVTSEQDYDDDEEGKKDLRSRGLCLVPISCTLQVGSDNGADYWAPALGGGFR